MKKILLLGLAVAISFASFGQKAQLKSGFQSVKKSFANKIAIEPVQPLKQKSVNPKPGSLKNDGDNPNIVTIIPLGSSANAYGYGYAGGQKTMVWADDNLQAVINLHRMGPGTTPPSLSGYLAVDLGTNYGVTAGDWQNNRQIYDAVLNGGGTYYADAARYPSGAIYNPAGNTSLANAYAVYFAPNLSNGGTWGGYSYGTANLVNQADSVKHMKWFAPPPYNYIPDGFSISQQGVALVVDKDYDETNLYHGNLIVNRGVWNSTNHDFEYTETLLPHATTDNTIPADGRLAFSPDGLTAWVVAISTDPSVTPLLPSYYPVFFKSTDGGITWSDPMPILLDGPGGIPGITQHLLSDYRITQIYDPIPGRDEIAYTTGFDCDIAVDMWGNPHIGTVVGLSGGAYDIITGPAPTYDSAWAVYDIYSTDGGTTWNAQLMGYPTTFRGTFGTLTEDNRVNIATTRAGDKMFLTWNDTQIAGITENNQCDVFARGFNLIANKITKNILTNACTPDNVTYLSDISQEASMECTSHYVFTQTGKCTIPIVAEVFTVPGDDTQPVDFKYISDFSYTDAMYTCDVFSENNPFPVGINDHKKVTSIDITIFPNPVKGTANVTVTVPNSGNLSMDVTNIVGQKILSIEKGNVNAGKQQFTIDGSKLSAGVYFCTVKLDDQSYTQKMIVK